MKRDRKKRKNDEEYNGLSDEYYDGPPIIPPEIENMTIEELDRELERVLREELGDVREYE